MCFPPRPQRRVRRSTVALAVAVVAAAACGTGEEAPPRRRVSPTSPPPVVPPATPPAAPSPPTPPAPPPDPGGARTVAVEPCADPAAGRWHARRWQGGEWIEHRVTLERVAHGDLRCSQEFRAWLGSIDDPLAPRCADGGRAYYLAHLDCEATQRGDRLELRSRTIVDLGHTCGGNVGRYNLDHMIGDLDGNVWDARNDDGADDVDQPYTFRRISCQP